MRGESKIKFFVLLMAMIVVITSNGPMTFAAGESDEIPNLPAVEEDQTIHSDASDEELADADVEEAVLSEDGKGEDMILGLSYNHMRIHPIVDITGVSINSEINLELIETLIEFSPESLEKNRIYVLRDKVDRYMGKVLDIPRDEVNIKRDYNDDLPYDELLEAILDVNRTGILLFHGAPGTGKSTLI